MKEIMAAVVSANGKLTRGQDPDIYKWTSEADQEHFARLRDQHDLIVMGSRTYEAVRGKIKPGNGKLRVVLTRNPERYQDEQIPGSLEFSSETPRELHDRMSDHPSMFVAGGAKIYTAFLKAGLIDEIYLTIEPVVFDEGINLFEDGDLRSKLELVSVKPLNKMGTILHKYRILK